MTTQLREQTEDKILTIRKSNEQDSERREKNDRRNLENSVDFPFKTKEGLIVMKDRRVRPDRRLNNIAVNNEDIDEEAFVETYRKFIAEK